MPARRVGRVAFGVPGEMLAIAVSLRRMVNLPCTILVRIRVFAAQMLRLMVLRTLCRCIDITRLLTVAGDTCTHKVGVVSTTRVADLASWCRPSPLAQTFEFIRVGVLTAQHTMARGAAIGVVGKLDLGGVTAFAKVACCSPCVSALLRSTYSSDSYLPGAFPSHLQVGMSLLGQHTVLDWPFLHPG